MDLDLAQRISLIQRNLATAQVMLDSAVELLNIIIAGVSVDHEYGSAPTTAKHKTAKRVEPTEEQQDRQDSPPRRGRPPKVQNAANPTAYVLDVMRSNPNTLYGLIEMDKALRAKGTAMPAKQIKQTMDRLRKTGKIVGTLKDSGRWKPQQYQLAS